MHGKTVISGNSRDVEKEGHRSVVRRRHGLQSAQQYTMGTRFTRSETKNSNALEANDCFLRAVEIYAKILELDKRNVMAYQSKAYDFYKYVIDHFTGKNKPALKNMKDVNIVECFDKMNATYDMLFAIDRPLAPVSEIKAKYRRGKAWGEVVLES